MQDQNGLIFCAKYAIPPNLLNYCGPKDNKALFDTLSDKANEEELRHLLIQFEGAVPYLKLIAQANNIKDFFDWRVIEAYWIGNELLNNIQAKDMFFNLEERFKKQMEEKDWNNLLENSMAQAKPHHNFHVLEVYRRMGHLKAGAPIELLENINNCCILWGRVEEKLEDSWAIVEFEPIEMFEGLPAGEAGKLQIGTPKNKKIQLTDPEIAVNDDISMHWHYICDKITPKQKERLIAWTKFHLELANKAK